MAKLEHDSVGLEVQVGGDFRIDDRWSVNLGMKKVHLRSDVEIGGAWAIRVKVAPLLLGMGVGYRFCDFAFSKARWSHRLSCRLRAGFLIVLHERPG
jgi:hypothetical protein